MTNENLLFDSAWIPLAESLPTNRRYPFILAILTYLQTGENTFDELPDTERMYFGVIQHKLASNARKQKSSEHPVGQGRPVSRPLGRGVSSGAKRPVGRPVSRPVEPRLAEASTEQSDVMPIAESA